MNLLDLNYDDIPTQEIFLGRQPILDRQQKTVAYELLFRSESSLHIANVSDDLAATASVIVNTLSQFGLEHVIGKNFAFINVSASLLMSETVELLPPNRIVLEVLEDVAITNSIVERCKALKEMGFKLALDDFTYRAEYDPLIPLLDFIKIDLTITPLTQIAPIVAALKKRTNALMVAEKVETAEQFKVCEALGFDLFQGFFFANPVLISGRKPQPQQMSLIRVMGMLLGDAGLDEIEVLFKDNPALSIGLLKLVNSVGIGGTMQTIKTLRQAIMVIGQKQLLRWVQLLLYATADGGSGGTLMQQVANRSRLMELIAKQMGSYESNFSDQAFMVGMLSKADVVMMMPLPDILKEIGLGDDLNEAILVHKGQLGDLLKLSEVIELGDFASARSKINKLGLTPNQLVALQLESMQWAAELEKA